MATAKFTATETTTPDGREGMRIACNCKVCNGKAAIIVKPRTYKLNQTYVHNMVWMVGGPAATATRGPWVA